jgi:PAS domain S-box-containing protein
MFIFGGEDGSKSLWMFIFPLIPFLLLGKKEGIVWAGSMLLIVFLCLVIPHSIVDKYPYSSAYLFRFTTIYLIISIMTYWFEHFRFSYRSEMQTEQRRFQEIFNHSRDVLYRRNLQSGQYQYISKAFGEHLGYSPAEVASFSYQDITTLIHPDDRDKHDPVLPEIINSKPSHEVTPPAEFRMRHKDGQYLWFSDQMVVIYNDDNEPEAFWASTGKSPSNGK